MPEEEWQEISQSGYKSKPTEDPELKRIAEERATTTDAIKGLLKRARRAFKQTFATLADTTPHLEELGGL